MADMNKNYKHEDLSYDKQISKINTVVTDKFDLLGWSEVNGHPCYQPDIKKIGKISWQTCLKIHT
jgi:hypothetical protein